MASAAMTLKDLAEVATPLGELTLMGPVTAPGGTGTTSLFTVADCTVAIPPLKLTLFCAGVVLKPLPQIVTVLPKKPAFGEKSIIDVVVALKRLVATVLPAAS